MAPALRGEHEVAVGARLRQACIDGIRGIGACQAAVASRERPLTVAAVLGCELREGGAVYFHLRALGDIYRQVVGRAVGVRRDADGGWRYVVYQGCSWHLVMVFVIITVSRKIHITVHPIKGISNALDQRVRIAYFRDKLQAKPHGTSFTRNIRPHGDRF